MSPFDKVMLLSIILIIVVVVLFCVVESNSMISYINIQFPYNVALLICDDGTTILDKQNAVYEVMV
jgi:hypothetical protein